MKFQEVLLVNILLNITYMSEILGSLKSNAQKMKLSIKDFTEEILNGKLHFLCSVKAMIFKGKR